MIVLWRMLGKIARGIRWCLVFLLRIAAILPWWEEFEIARAYGQACRTDAGLTISRTVSVRGFYDSTRPTHDGPVNVATAEELDQRGYAFYELLYRDEKGGATKIVHLDKQDGRWIATVLDRPRAEYQFQDELATQIRPKVFREASSIVKIATGEKIAQYVRYSRQAPWYYVGLDSPGMGCDDPSGGPQSKKSSRIYREVLTPSEN